MIPATACPDWAAVTRRRDADEGAWNAAVAHLDGGCRACFDAAVGAEPTLLFRRLPRAEPSTDAIAALRQGVAAMRRAEAVTAPRRTAARSGAAHRWLAAAAVAAVTVAGGLLQGGGPTPRAGVAEPIFAATPVAIAAGPLVEDLGAHQGEVVQVVDAELDLLVLVSDLDV